MPTGSTDETATPQLADAVVLGEQATPQETADVQTEQASEQSADGSVAPVKKSNTFVIIAIVILFILIVFAGSVWYFFVYQTSSSSASASNVNQPSIQSPSNTEQVELPETPQAPVVQDDSSTAPTLTASDSMADIEEDLNNSELDTLEDDFAELDTELESL